MKRNSLSYHTGFLASIFASQASDYDSLKINEQSLVLLSGKKQKVVPFLEIEDDINIESGIFWNVLQIPLLSGEKINLGGINKKESALIFQHFNTVLCHYLSAHYRKYFSEIKTAEEELETFLSAHHYFRHSFMDTWLLKYQHLKNILYRKNIKKFFSETEYIVAEKIKYVLKDPEFVRNQRNHHFINQQIESYKTFFDNIESNPLTPSQRKACVVQEDFNLVLAGAGTGKTSTMIAKAGYLLKAGLAKPENILMLAYGNKAAAEMDERIIEKLGINDLSVSTFHSFGQQVISTVENKKPALSILATDSTAKIKFIDDTIHQLLKDKVYQTKLINYFIRYLYPARNQLDFKTREEYVAYCNDNQLRSLKGDAVKSFEELEIANFLYTKGIPYKYEANYIKDTSGPDYRVYQPDFYLTEDDIYLEHFAIDRNYNTPPFIDGAKYREGIEWKRQLHKKYQTRLIETYSYENKEGILLENLEKKLIENQVKFKSIKNDELFEKLKELGKISIWSQLMADLLNIFKAAFSSINEVIEIAKTHTDHLRMIVAIELFEPIYEKYQAYLVQTKTIDFDDMISKAIQYIETGRYRSPFKFVLVDEFQDISASRAHLIKSLLAQNKFNSLFCVGDDWQSIYRFSGSDVSITKNFQDYFGQTAQNVLETTFRFNNKIGDVAASFITKNPHQINKKIQSFHSVEHESVSIIQTASDQQGLEIALSSIAQKNKNKASVLVLARFNFKKPERFNRLIKNFPNLDIQFMSVHASKGKEADYVIILGMEKGKHGFPSEKITHPILNMLLPKAENFKYAEERRLFYVALTRARNYVYLVSNAQKSSPFIRELKKGGYAVLTDEFKGTQVQEDTEEVSCSTCKDGYLVSRNGTYGDFHACSNYPYCGYRQKVCKNCGQLQRKVDRFLKCTNKQCNHIEPICPLCGGIMQLRNGRHNKFWGCSNYRRSTDFPCKHTEKYIDLNEVKNLM